MTVTTDVRSSGTALRQFLDARLPQRHQIADAWGEQLKAYSRHGFEVRGNPAMVGKALEVRIALDLADEPAHWELLEFLPPDVCAALLSSAGFARREFDPPTGTTDPRLCEWVVTSRPDGLDAHQREGLRAVLAATGMDDVAHHIEARFSVELRRQIFLPMWNPRSESGPQDNGRPSNELRALEHLWEQYVTHGRAQLPSLGERVVVAPVLAPGYAQADLSIGRALVEIKTYLDPAPWLPTWLDQLLAYTLLDRWNLLRIDTLALYLGWESVVFTTSIDELLQTASPGTTPQITALREDFHNAMYEVLLDAHYWHKVNRYPFPSEAVRPPDNAGKSRG